MRTAYQKMALNKVLGHHGLALLSDPHALFDQIAGAIKTHDDLRKMIDKCEPHQRPSMYQAIAPRLGFQAKELDTYVAELTLAAEIKQLPTIGPNGQLLPFRVPEVASDEYIAQKAVALHLARFTLIVTCRKCTRQAEFGGQNKSEAIKTSRDAGWAYDEVSGSGREICPKCMDAVPGRLIA